VSIENWVFQHFDDPRMGQSDIVVLCPFCQNRIGSPDLSGHLYISTVEQTCHCFRCNYAASWMGLVRDVTGSTYKEARDELRQERLVPLYKLMRTRAPTENPVQMPESFRTIRQAEGHPLGTKLSKAAAQYVEMRVAPYRDDWQDLLDRWGVWLDAAGIGRLVLPVERGWWQERNISDPDPRPKYTSPPVPKGDRLYNGTALTRYETVYVAEGIISAACIGESAVAMCGKSAVPEQMRRLGMAKVKQYVVCLDSDAQRDAIKLAEELHSFGKEVYVRKYESGDPASCTEYEDVQFTWRTAIEMRMT
jgi:DNA primase